VVTQKQRREFQQWTASITCREKDCGRRHVKTYAEIMSTEKFLCEGCGKPLPFDKAKWQSEVFKQPRMSTDEKISEKGRTKA
jgi:hypothetical protein